MAPEGVICRGTKSKRNGNRGALGSMTDRLRCRNLSDLHHPKHSVCWLSARTRPRNWHFALSC